MRTQRTRKMPSWIVGLVALIVVAVASYFAYTKQLPWHDGYEVKAVFSTAQNIRVNSPVRIAGVDVGKVTAVEHLTNDAPELRAAAGGDANTLPDDAASGEQAAVVTMEIEEEGRPIHEDATFQLRPRLFLEGNLFVDVKPGTPSAPEADEGYQFPIQQSSVSVQLDQVLTTLQADVRGDLRTFLDQFGNALIKYDGAQNFRELYASSPGAYKFTAQVNDAFLGTRPHDLSGLVRGLDKVLAGLDRHEQQLQELVTNFRVFSGSFAAQDEPLQEAIAELPGVLDAAHPAFVNLNDAFPSLRAFAREALPGVRSTGPAIDAALPFIHQVRELVSEDELRGLVADLRPTIPKLAKLARRTIPFLEESRRLSSCFNEVIIPWSNDSVDVVGAQDEQYTYDDENLPGNVHQETAYGLAGIAGESRSGDANGQYIRVQAAGGTNTVLIPESASEYGEDAFGLTPFEIRGAAPALHDSAKTPFRPDVRCETQEQPNLDAGGGPGPDQEPTAAPTTANLPDGMAQAVDRYVQLTGRLAQVAKLAQDGRNGAAQALADKTTEELQRFLEQYRQNAASLGGGG